MNYIVSAAIAFAGAFALGYSLLRLGTSPDSNRMWIDVLVFVPSSTLGLLTSMHYFFGR